MAADWARPVVHWDIRARDPELIKRFYAQLFNWEIGEGPVMQIPAGVGGPEGGLAGHIYQSDHTGVTLYIQVRDLRSTLDKAVRLGGTIVLEPFDVAGGPSLARVRDPEGNPIMLVQQ